MYRWIGWITVCYFIFCTNIGAAAPPRLSANSQSTLLIPAGMNSDDAIGRLVAQAPAAKDKTVVIDGESAATALPAARERGAIVASMIATAVSWIDGLELVQADQAPAAGNVGLQTTDAVLLVSGRELINLGPGEVKLHLARCEQRESRVVTLAE
ncbi:MAG TPA: hypothetical protein VL096_08425, partial [Pirellulaceae bacterium]|nr:hypothetical protein [Pirellulaceae bacterium]